MEAELKKLLDPVIINFIQSLVKTRELWEIKYKSSLTQINENLSQELDKTQKERDSLKAQKEENEKSTALTKSKLEDAVAKQTTLNDELSKQAAQYSKLSKELADKLKEIEQNLENSRLDKNTTIETSEKAHTLLVEYNAKLNSLKDDSDKLALRNIEYSEREKNIKVKEKSQLNKETIQNEEAHRLKDLDLSIRAREAEVSRLIRRYKLEQSIKEG